MNYTGGIMALYSWFNKNKPSNKNTRSSTTLLKTSESTKCVENYTMWPTAKIKVGVTAGSTVHNSIKTKPVNNLSESQSIYTAKRVSIKTTAITKK